MRVIALGAGITNLSIADELAKQGHQVTVLEKTPKVGGMAASFDYKGFILDYGPHKFYTQLPGINDEFKRIVGEGNYNTIKKKNSIRMLGKYFEFPVRITQLVRGIKPTTAAAIMRDFGFALLKKRKVHTYEDYFLNGFGKTGYSILFKGYAEKVWDDPKLLSHELARKRVPVGSVIHLLKNMVFKPKANVSAEYFMYPKKGIGVIVNNIEKSLQKRGGEVIINADATRIITEGKKVKGVEFKSGGTIKEIQGDVVITSMPITDLPLLLEKNLPSEVKAAAGKLAYRGLIIAYVFLNKPRVLKDNWIFFPEKEFCFNRVAEPVGSSSDVAPGGKTVLTAELTCTAGDRLYNAPEDEIKAMVVKDLVKAGLIKAEWVSDFMVRKARRVYPVYHVGYQEHLAKVLEFVDTYTGIYPTGRLGLFNYNNIDHCLDMARVTTEIISNGGDKEKWKNARKYFDSYQIVD